MPSLYCEQCGYRIRFRATVLWMENCPRCEAHSKTLSPLVLSPPARWRQAKTDRPESQPSGTRLGHERATPVG